MQIVSGIAGGIKLTVPKGLAVRPTSVRARKALFDSISDFEGKIVVDLFSGSGALGLEAASRGAEQVILVEQERRHCKAIEENIEKVRKAGVKCNIELVNADASNCFAFCRAGVAPDYIFADPPYDASGKLFLEITGNQVFTNWAGNAVMIWEFPHEGDLDGSFLKSKSWNTKTRRSFGGTTFIFARSLANR